MSARRPPTEAKPDSDLDVLKDNERLHAELRALVGRHDKERGSNVTFGGSQRTTREEARPEHRHSSKERVEATKPVPSKRQGSHLAEESQQRVHREPDNQKLMETLDALEYMKKREKALQEEVKSLSQVLVK